MEVETQSQKVEEVLDYDGLQAAESSAVVAGVAGQPVVEENLVETATQEVQDIRPEVESYWQTKKEEFVEEMRRLLATGIDICEEGRVSECVPEVLEKKLSEAGAVLGDNSKAEQWNETQKRLVKECALWLVEGKSGSEFDLMKLSGIVKDYTETHLSIGDKTIEFYRDIIAEGCEKKNYGIKITKDITAALQKNAPAGTVKMGLHEIWEVKEMQVLAANAKLEELDFQRKKSRHHSALLRSLEKLVKSIERGKGEDDAFGSYQKIASNPPSKKVQLKINAQSKKPPQVVEEKIEENLKKMKLDVAEENSEAKSPGKEKQLVEKQQKKKQTKRTGQSAKKGSNENKDKEETSVQGGQDDSQCGVVVGPTEDSIQNLKNTQQNNAEASKNSTGSASSGQKKKASNSSGNAAPVSQPPSGQKNLFSFFKKPAVTPAISSNQDENNGQSINLPSQQIPLEIEQNQQIPQAGAQPQAILPAKSIFRKIGAADPRPSSLQTTEIIKDIHNTADVFQAIQQASLKQWSLMKDQRKKNTCLVSKSKGGNTQRRRRILVVIHDYIRQYRNAVFEQKSKVINPRRPLARDEDLIQYDLDSEDELQELNAENIENDEDDADEDDADEGESAEQFIVPDGYLSDEGLDSDREEVYDQKKLTFQNYNFTESASKQGFIFQEKDKTLDVVNFLQNYKARIFNQTEAFPLLLKKKTDEAEADVAAGNGSSIHHIWTGDRLKAFIRLVHGQFLPKKTLLEQIGKLEVMKDVSKNRLEKKFREIVQKDEKSEAAGGNLRSWFVNSAVIDSLEFDENEMNLLKKNRLEEFKATKVNKKEEKQAQQQQQSLSQQPQPLSQSPPQQAKITPSLAQPLAVKVASPITNIFSTAPPLKKDFNIMSAAQVIRSSSQERGIQKDKEEELKEQSQEVANATQQDGNNAPPNNEQSQLIEIEEVKITQEDSKGINDIFADTPSEEIKNEQITQEKQQQQQQDQNNEGQHGERQAQVRKTSLAANGASENSNTNSKRNSSGKKQATLMDMFKKH